MWYWWALGCAAAALLLVAAVSNRLAFSVIRPPRDTREEAERQEIERGNLALGELDSFPLEEKEASAFDGVTLKYFWYRADGPTNRACVLCHGFGSRREHMLKYAKLYHERGYDVLLFDHRNSGDSGGKFTTMGYKERKDLQLMVALARADKAAFGGRAVVGAHGESMGGATVLLTACMDAPPDFVVSDCAYADLREQLLYHLRHAKHLPPQPFAPIAERIARHRAGFAFSEVSPLGELKRKNGLPELPILFAHGEADTLIPCEAAKKLYAAKKGKKRLYLCPNAGHARSIAANREAYRAALFDFLDEYHF